ncbi:hypothetical protein RHSIM_Rhsim11G0194100 [Rhododendron simsii]|uniref:Uncharacterized protein n=1 Tax=Rhododendron simsii TaxID=118357 RepID=A0A834LBA4_RHOSS|nr:hypothetical protein RHSIM_Rhsim11G0194100 [Rhododendron simsii]
MGKGPKTRLDTAIVNVWQREVGQLSTRNFAHRFAASEEFDLFGCTFLFFSNLIYLGVHFCSSVFICGKRGGVRMQQSFNGIFFLLLQDLVLRLELFRKLEKHRGCVNTVSFNEDGDILVSGSDDRRVIFWEWETGLVKLSFHSGHYDNVFQAKIMPYTEDRTVVTCAADGQVMCFLELLVKDSRTSLTAALCLVIESIWKFSMVRHTQILERGEVETKLLGKHEGRAHKLAIEPGSPHIFYTCGEDGLVQHFDLRTGAATQLFTCQSVLDSSFSIDLNAIAIDPRNPNLIAIAGLDEYTRLYDIRKYKRDGSTDFGQPTDYFCPPHLIGHEQMAITGLAFSDLSELLVSYSDEFIYLFTREMGLGPNPPPASPLSLGGDAGEMGPEQKSASPPSDVDVKVGPQVYKGHKNFETVKGVNFFGPKCEYVVSGSDCGRIFIWKKGGELIRVMEADEHVVNCIESHPHSTVLVSSGIEDNIKVWTPKALERMSLPTNIEKVCLAISSLNV